MRGPEAEMVYQPATFQQEQSACDQDGFRFLVVVVTLETIRLVLWPVLG